MGIRLTAERPVIVEDQHAYQDATSNGDENDRGNRPATDDSLVSHTRRRTANSPRMTRTGTDCPFFSRKGSVLADRFGFALRGRGRTNRRTRMFAPMCMIRRTEHSGSFGLVHTGCTTRTNGRIIEFGKIRRTHPHGKIPRKHGVYELRATVSVGDCAGCSVCAAYRSRSHCVVFSEHTECDGGRDADEIIATGGSQIPGETGRFGLSGTTGIVDSNDRGHLPRAESDSAHARRKSTNHFDQRK